MLSAAKHLCICLHWTPTHQITTILTMAFVWLVECKTCTLRFAVKPRDIVPGKSTDAITSGQNAGSFECPHCHEFHQYSTDDFIPGEGRIRSR
jgi:hypothetical protein